MLDFLRDIFKSDAGSFGFVFGVFGAICYAVHYITKFATKINTERAIFSDRIGKIENSTDIFSGRVGKIENSTDMFSGRIGKIENNTDKISGRVGKIENSTDMFSDRIGRIENNTDKIREDIIIIRASMKASADSYTQSQSPVSLTQKGMEIADRLKIYEIVTSNWDRIFQYIEKSVKDKNAYDIQQFCIERATINLLEFFTEEDVREIKTVAFQEGRSIESFGGLIGVIIRNTYFAAKEIDINEVDRSDPQKKA
jgi:hypothetical protein